MNYSKKIFIYLWNSVDWVELALLILNSGIGLALTHYLAYKINWIHSSLFIFWLVFFYLGNVFLNINIKRFFTENDYSFKRDLTSIFQVLTFLFFGLSFIPLVQILLASFDNYLVIYLICFLALWFLLKKTLENRRELFGISETISAFMTSFIIPVIVLNINSIRIHEFLVPIAFFVFLEIIASKFIREFYVMNKTNEKSGFMPLYIGLFTLQRTIAILIPFNYLACIFLLSLQGRIQFYKPLLITFPFAAYIVYKISRIHDIQREQLSLINQTAIVFVLLAVISWIFDLLVY